ncbi:hypothetical protein A2W24_00010 [Microgenomates group bacterium RBG_16_45_19]|nr:MAG: hypothetical protein A2W24_00010 [Microgenomates group bacterium RBG_16_45_19]
MAKSKVLKPKCATLVQFDENAAMHVFCQTCADFGINPILYSPENIDFITQLVARDIKYGDRGHGFDLCHEVHFLDGHLKEKLRI